MYKNQLGRRNLTESQRFLLLGKLHEARKHTHGGDRKSEKSKPQSEVLKSGSISVQIAKEQGVGHATVSRAGEFANGIDAIREADEELANAILMAEKKEYQGFTRG